MVTTRRTRNLLAFLLDNVDQGLETMKEAKQFAGRIEEFSEDERLFVDCALSSRRRLRDFCSAIET